MDTRSHDATPEPSTPAAEPVPAGAETLLVRLGGDLTTKSRVVRSQFVRRLARNLRDVLRSEGVEGRVTRTHDRIFVDGPAPLPIRALSRVFGVQSASPAVRRSYAGLDDLVESGCEIFGQAVRGHRFAVRARRVGDRGRIPVSARDLERELGSRLLPASAGVDLRDPEVTAGIELAPDEAWLHSETLRGPGGLPLGAEGRALALVSGGFDSAVAAWLVLKRGVALDYVFCNLGGRTHQLGTLRVMKEIADRWSYGSRPRLHAVDFDEVSRDLREHTRPRYWQIVLKRLMLRAADAVARETGAEAAVTGEALGQVSSQTLRNLGVIDRASELPVLRPLAGFNKDEILDVARRIGTHDLSRVVGEYCAMVPRRPATGAAVTDVEAQEAHLDASLLERAVAERDVFDLRRLDVDKLDAPDLAVGEIPDGATVIDLRPLSAYRAWHLPGSLHLDFARALRAHPHFERGRPYVLFCEFGLKSAHLAELMRREGLEAYHFRHGLGEVWRWCRRHGIPVPERR